MRELNDSGWKTEYVRPVVIRLGSSAAITAGQNQLNSDDAVNPDNAFPNPAGES